MVEGLQKSPPGSPPKLRLNSVLNSMTRRGPFLGNNAGMLAMVYNLINSTMGHYRGKHDSANSLAAGALSGILFKSTRGVRSMAISGGLVASVAGIWAVSLLSFFRSQVSGTNLRADHKKDSLLLTWMVQSIGSTYLRIYSRFSGYCIAWTPTAFSEDFTPDSGFRPALYYCI